MMPPAAKPQIPFALPPLNKSANTAAAPTVSNPAVPNCFLPSQGGSSNNEVHTKQLQDAFLRALNQIQPQGQAPPQQAPPSSAQENTAQHQQQQPQANLAPAIPSHSSVPQQYQPIAPKVPPAPTSTNIGSSNQASTQHPAPAVPNILLGFELMQNLLKVLPLQQSQMAACVAPPVASHETPFVTSRSFDDFHRLLGKDVAMLDEQLQDNNSKDNDDSIMPSVSDTSALFTAESYALLAQESASEASSHAAYHLSPSGLLSIPAHQSSAVTQNFDIDGMLKQLLSNNALKSTVEQQESGDGGAGTATMNQLQQQQPQGASCPINGSISSSIHLEQQRKPQPTASTARNELTPVERFVGVSTNMVSSGSEPSGDSASSASGGIGGSFRGSDTNMGGSSLDNTSNDSEEDGCSSSSNSDSDNPASCPPWKKVKITDHRNHSSSPGEDGRLQNEN